MVGAHETKPIMELFADESRDKERMQDRKWYEVKDTDRRTRR
jgi:hypothetical protein